MVTIHKHSALLSATSPKDAWENYTGISHVISQAHSRILHLCMQPDNSFLQDASRADDLEKSLRVKNFTIDFERIHIPKNEQPSSPIDTYNAIVIGGGSYGVHDNLSCFETARSVIRQAIDNKIPTLGFCLGHQLIGQEVGAKIERGIKGPEIGVVDIALTSEGKKHELFYGISSHILCHSNHQDVVTHLPQGCIELAQNSYANQVVEYASNIWGVQFHPERSKRTMYRIFQGKLTKATAKRTIRALKVADLQWTKIFLKNFLHTLHSPTR